MIELTPLAFVLVLAVAAAVDPVRALRQRLEGSRGRGRVPHRAHGSRA